MNKITTRRVFAKKEYSIYQFDMRDSKNTRNTIVHGYVYISREANQKWHFAVKIMSVLGEVQRQFYCSSDYVTLAVAKKEFKLWLENEYE